MGSDGHRLREVEEVCPCEGSIFCRENAEPGQGASYDLDPPRKVKAVILPVCQNMRKAWFWEGRRIRIWHCISTMYQLYIC